MREAKLIIYTLNYFGEYDLKYIYRIYSYQGLIDFLIRDS